MLANCLFSSLARISTLQTEEFSAEPLPRQRWRTGDYVVGEVVEVGGFDQVELATGRIATVTTGDWIIGALGKRSATLEAVGDWRDIGHDNRFQALNLGCVFGKCTARSSVLRPLMTLEYRGHVTVRGEPRNMRDYVPPQPNAPLAIPLILILGTSMDSGKTTTARVIIRLLKARGLSVGGIKFTGVGRYRDILAMGDAGADVICDFVDAGLPSTSCPRAEFEFTIDYLLARLAAFGVDVIVAEAGASPLEPYNGDAVIEGVRDRVRCTVLCASDPYAVVGIQNSFDLHVDLVAGRATSTSAAVDLVEKLCQIRALNVMDRSTWPALDQIISNALGSKQGT